MGSESDGKMISRYSAIHPPWMYTVTGYFESEVRSGGETIFTNRLREIQKTDSLYNKVILTDSRMVRQIPCDRPGAPLVCSLAAMNRYKASTRLPLAHHWEVGNNLRMVLNFGEPLRS